MTAQNEKPNAWVTAGLVGALVACFMFLFRMDRREKQQWDARDAYFDKLSTPYLRWPTVTVWCVAVPEYDKSYYMWGKLTRKGEDQAMAAALTVRKQIGGEGGVVILTSPLDAAHRTANIIRGGSLAPVITCSWLDTWWRTPLQDLLFCVAHSMGDNTGKPIVLVGNSYVVAALANMAFVQPGEVIPVEVVPL